MEIPLGEVVYFDVITTNYSTGAAQDADATPTFEVFEEATDTDIGVGGNLTKRTSKTGNYRGSFTASSANGFELGKWYSVIASYTVNSVAQKQRTAQFRIIGAETSAGYPEVRPIAAAQPNTWYFATTGNAGNDGKTWATAKALLSECVSAAASGDTILGGPGTFTESTGINATTKALCIRGAGSGTKITQNAVSYTIALGSNSTLENLWVDNTYNSISATAISVGNKSEISLRRVKGSSSFGVGAILGSASCNDLFAEECLFTGRVGGMYGQGSRAILRRVVGLGTGDNPGADTYGLKLQLADSEALDCIGQANHNQNGYTARGAHVLASPNLVRLQALGSRNVGLTTVATGLYVESGDPRIQDSWIAGLDTDIYANASSTIYLDGVSYDPDKVAGTGEIMDLTRQSAEAAIEANNLDHLMKEAVTSSDVADNSALAKLASKLTTAAWSSYNNVSHSLEAQADAPVSLTSAYDAAKTAAQAGNAMTLTTGERTAVADTLLGRSVSTIEATAAEHSLCTIVLATLESSVSGSTWTIKRTDGGTTHVTKTVTSDADALPITGVS